MVTAFGRFELREVLGEVDATYFLEAKVSELF